MPRVKLAIVHDYLNQSGGAERVVGVFHRMFPDAPIYTTILDRDRIWPDLREADIRTSWMQRLPGLRAHFKKYLLCYPWAIESLDLRAYDVVLSSSSAFAKGARARPGAVHLCYCYTPMRFVWQHAPSVERERIGRVARLALAPAIACLRRWDLRTAARPDQYIAISSVVAERIRRWYGRDSQVIPPPVDITRFGPSDGVDRYYLVVSRLNGYKRIDLAVDAFSRIGLPLVVVGEGPQRADLERRAGGNVRFLGALPDPEVAALYARCKALVLPGEEDFGLTVIEANASGRPVVAFAAGGALDSVVEGVTGVLFEHQAIDSLTAAVDKCERQVWSSELLRRHAEGFGEEAFRSRFMAALARLLETKRDDGRPQPSDPGGSGRSCTSRSEARHSSS